jgi:rhamnogalacturonan endolyase
VRVERDVQSDWGAGYCTDAYVYNDGATDVVWSHVEDVGGTLQSAWNAQTEDLGGGSVRFWGMDYNEVVPAGERVSFGYCVER